MRFEKIIPPYIQAPKPKHGDRQRKRFFAYFPIVFKIGIPNTPDSGLSRHYPYKAYKRITIFWEYYWMEQTFVEGEFSGRNYWTDWKFIG